MKSPQKKVKNWNQKRYLWVGSSSSKKFSPKEGSLLISQTNPLSFPKTTLSETESDLDPSPQMEDPRIESKIWGLLLLLLGLGFLPHVSFLRCCFLRLVERITTIGGFFCSRRLRSWRYEPPPPLQSFICCFCFGFCLDGGLGEGEVGGKEEEEEGFWRRRRCCCCCWRAKDLARVKTPSEEEEGETTSIKAIEGSAPPPSILLFLMYFPIFRRFSSEREKRNWEVWEKSELGLKMSALWGLSLFFISSFFVFCF